MFGLVVLPWRTELRISQATNILLVTGWYNDKYLYYVNGAMVEGFFTYGGLLIGNVKNLIQKNTLNGRIVNEKIPNAVPLLIIKSIVISKV
jgi:hypothetical protein